MTIARRALILYIAGIIVLVAHVFLFRNPPTGLFKEVFFYLLPVGVLLVGLVIGWFAFMIIQHAKWIRSFYIFGLNLSFTLFVATLGFFHIQAWLKDRRYGYDPAGREMLENDDENGKRYVADGFEKLQRSFTNPRQVHLLEYLVTYRDTTIGFEKDSTRTVYYTYYLGKDSAAVHFSKVEWRKQQTRIIAFDQLPASDTAYLRLDREFCEWRVKRLDSVLSLLKTTTDH
jgi:hypothetical protein